LCALAINRFFITFTRLRRFIPVITTASGILLILVGVLVLTDKLQELGYLLLNWLPSLEMR
jgi:cytochrome c-type biogenesis protein